MKLTTTAMATDGRAISRNGDGKVVFVEGALPGETVEVQTVEEKPSWVSARVIDILQASDDRVDPPCPRRAEGCGGCPWQHISPPAQGRIKASLITESIQRLGGVAEVPLARTIELPPWGWRTSIRAAVQDGYPALRQGHSHRLVPMPGCQVAHPLIGPLLEGPLYPGAESVLLRCGARTGERLASVSPQRGRPRATLPEDTHRRYFHEHAAGRRWRISARSFFQSRPDGADALADLVVRATQELAPAETGGGHAVDLYSGVGLFAGVLAEQGWRVTAVEGSPTSARDARHNLAGLPVEVVGADVNRWEPIAADLVVADPSRAGLGRRATQVVAATGARRVVLISCDVASLGRDIGLLDTVGYSLRSVTPVDVFSHSWRVEVVSVLDRRPGSARA